MKNLTCALVFLSILSVKTGVSQTTAKYDITFTSIWNAGDHTSIPPNAHWSKLVGATHKTENIFFQVGNIASTGIKNIAETGNNTVFNTEVITEITNTEGNQYIDGPSLGTATGDMVIFDLIVSEDFPLLTLASMIAPSPDWMIGVNGFSLLDGGNNWKTSAIIDMYALDAGTDDGTDYTSTNVLSSPFQPVSLINGAPFQGNKIGTLTITLIEVLGVEDNVTFQNVNIFPNPVSNGNLNISNLENVTLSKVEIYNIAGTKIKSFNNDLSHNHLSLDVQNIPFGIYLLKLTSDQDKLAVRKVVIE